LNEAKPTESRSAERAGRIAFGVALAAALAMLLLLAWPMLGGRVYDADDLGTLHLPMRWFYSHCLARGESFLWLPNLFCGYYIHGEGQAGMCHPFHLLLYRLAPLNWAFNIELLHSYPLAFVGMFLFLRRHRVALHAAVFGSFAFAFSGYTMWHYTHMHVVAIVAHIPWLLFCMDVAMRSQRRWSVAAALLGAGLLTASQLLLGHPQHVWFSLLAAGMYGVWLVSSREAAGRLLLLGVFTLAGIAAAGVQLLPSWDVLSGSVRADPSLAFRSVGSLHPLNLAQVVAPYLFSQGAFIANAEEVPHEFALYNGALVPAAVALLLIRRKELGGLRRPALGAAVLAVLALVLALGRYGYLYRLQALVPFIGLFREPARYIVLFHLASAVLIAVALSDLWSMAREGRRVEWRRLWPLAVPPAFSVLAVICVWGWLGGRSDPFLSGQCAPFPRLLIGPALIVAATLLMVLAARGVRHVVIALLLFGAVDLGFYGLSYVRRTRAYPIERVIAWLPTPPDAALHRLYADDWSASNRLLMRGLRLANGYAGLYPRKTLDYSRELCQQAAGVQWTWVERPRQGWRWAGLPPMPRARLLSQALVSDDPNGDLERIDMAAVALVSSQVALTHGDSGAVEIVRDQPGKISLTASAPTRQLLVVSESYHSGWEANVDRQPAAVVRVYGDFMGCVLEPGEHAVEFNFVPASFRHGLWMSLAGLAVLLALPLIRWLKVMR